jgi:hypothetical protein
MVVSTLFMSSENLYILFVSLFKCQHPKKMLDRQRANAQSIAIVAISQAVQVVIK